MTVGTRSFNEFTEIAVKRLLAASLVAASLAAPAAAATFTFDFESGTPAEFTGEGFTAPAGAMAGYNGFAGNFWLNNAFANQATNIALSGLAAHDQVSLSFGLALIDSWDGQNGAPAPDYFSIYEGNNELFRISVGNASGGNSELIPASATNRSQPGNVVYSYWPDSIFDVAFSFAHSGSTLGLSLFAHGAGWQGSSDESWGIDNLVITTREVNQPAPVPLPAGLPLLLAGLGALGLVKRRKR